MGKDLPEEEAQAASEMEAAEKDLESDIDKMDKEARERLDELLSEKNMEFCSRCSAKVSSRGEWAGKCWHEGCGNLLCRKCWSVNHFRYCRDHCQKAFARGGKNQEELPDKEGGTGDFKAGLRKLLEESGEGRIQRLTYYASEYARWLEKRIDKEGPPDWTPREFIANPVTGIKKEDGEFVVRIMVRKWLRKKTKLGVVVFPLDPGQSGDFNYLNAHMQKRVRKEKCYMIFVLVGDGVTLDVVNFVNRFSDKGFSLFLVEPVKGNLYFNASDPADIAYSDWFSQKKEPKRFEARLKRLADLVSGRLVVSAGSVAKDLGTTDEYARKMLKACKFLESIRDTDTFFWKDEDRKGKKRV